MPFHPIYLLPIVWALVMPFWLGYVRKRVNVTFYLDEVMGCWVFLAAFTFIAVHTAHPHLLK